jgi:hypothetical protein
MGRISTVLEISLENLAAADSRLSNELRDWIEEQRKKRIVKRFRSDPFLKMRGLFASGRPDMGRHFDDYLYGGKK